MFGSGLSAQANKRRRGTAAVTLTGHNMTDTDSSTVAQNYLDTMNHQHQHRRYLSHPLWHSVAIANQDGRNRRRQGRHQRVSSNASEGRPPRHPNSSHSNHVYFHRHQFNADTTMIEPYSRSKDFDEYRNEKYPAVVLLAKSSRTEGSSSTIDANNVFMAQVRYSYNEDNDVKYTHDTCASHHQMKEMIETENSVGRVAPCFTVSCHLEIEENSTVSSLSLWPPPQPRSPSSFFSKMLEMLQFTFSR